MYVCICNAVTENQVKNALREGATTLEDLRNTLSVGTCCGCCTEYLESRLVQSPSQETPQDRASPQRAA